MSRSKEDNTVAVIQRAIRFHKIRVTKTSVRETLKTHPHYPALLSICDAFKEWKVGNYPLRYTEDEILELFPPYIVHFKERGGQVAFVTRVKDNKITFYESFRKRITLEAGKFIERCSGAVILLNPDKDSGEKDYKRKKQDELLGNSVLPGVLLTVFLILGFAGVSLLSGVLVTPGLGNLLLIFTKSSGIALSLLLVLHEFDLHNALTDKLCHLTKSTDCNTVLHDRAAKIFSWFGWADLGLIYFTGGLMLLPRCLSLLDFSYLALLASISLPYTVFSVIYQGFVLKKWCPLCLGVQILFIIEFVILLPGLVHLSISWEATKAIFSTFLLTGLIYVLFNLYYREKKANELNYIKYSTLKFNPLVLNTLLLSQKHYDIPLTGQSLLFGKQDAGMVITAFLSLQCSHCARAFQRIKELLKSGENLKISIVLITQDKAVLNTLYHLNHSGEEKNTIVLLDRWYNTDPYSRQSFSEDYCIPDVEDISEEVSNENIRLFKECGVFGTPAFFINGYQLPKQYNLDDLKHIAGYINTKEFVTQDL